MPRAATICGTVGCPDPATNRGRCAQHQPEPWQGSTRAARLPSNWDKLRLRVLRRDKWRCQIDGPACTTVAGEVDHIEHGDNHAMENLRAVCATCHREVTQRQANEWRTK